MYSSAPKTHVALWTLLFAIAFILALVANYFWFRTPAHTTPVIPSQAYHVDR